MFKLNKHCNKLIKLLKCTPKPLKPFTNFSTVRIHTNNLFFPLPFQQLRLYSNLESEPEANSEILTLDEAQIQELTEGDEDQINKLKMILLEAELMRQEGKAVPTQSSMKMEHWVELLSKTSRAARRKYLDFLFKLEKKKENKMAKKEIRRQELGNREEVIVDGPMRYDLGHNNMFLRFYDSTINNFYNNQLMRAMQFSQKIVVDCGYEENMNKRELINCAKQLTIVFAENRAHQDPFDLHYCNLKPNGILADYLSRMVPTMHDEAFPMNVHECSYADMFENENLVYLTPHCRTEMEAFDHDAVYIIGGIVDKMNNEPVSLAKAKRERIKMAKFPIDQHLLWGSGSGKSLTINQAILIMLDMRLTNDWKYSFRHVPKRKLVMQETVTEKVDPPSPYKASYKSFNRDRAQEWGIKNTKNNTRIANNSSKSGWRPSFTINKDDSQNKNENLGKERLLNLKNILND